MHENLEFDDKELNKTLNDLEEIVKSNPDIFKEKVESYDILSIFDEIKQVQKEMSELNKKLYERTKKA
jgi:ElaB/YqjD/DUF883 family membrane-anchored ribosome-binding protein